MNFVSTRSQTLCISSAESIARGISPDGGLFVPTHFPAVSPDELAQLTGLPYHELAAFILGRYCTDFAAEELSALTKSAYGPGRFTDPAIAPVRRIDDNTHLLELFHGPTCAFKDMALQILPGLMAMSAKRSLRSAEIVVLTATSGDTGKAALEGFRDQPGVKIVVYYPKRGVSPVQELQMITQQGENLCVVAVEGNFDDAQNAVKALFNDRTTSLRLAAANRVFSSANSINIGRLLPQVVYYFSAYCGLVTSGAVGMGDAVHVAVPSGNFGNILAAYYAKRMGLPIGRLICASNQNNILTDFLRTGVYDRNRPFYSTISPSMDILISSNLERLIHHLSDAPTTEALMRSLRQTGRFEVPKQLLHRMQESFFAYSATEEETLGTIRRAYESASVLLDPHTAVGYKALNDYRQESADHTPAILAATASPFKFPKSVLAALGHSSELDELSMLPEIAKLSGAEIPASLRELSALPVRFTDSVRTDGMAEALFRFLAR